MTALCSRAARLIGALLLLGAATGEAPAQYLLRGQPQAFAGNDFGIALKAAETVLESGAAGAARPWSNPDTGHHGTVEVLRRYHDGGRPCADIQLVNMARDGMAYVLRSCRFANGSWQLVG